MTSVQKSVKRRKKRKTPRPDSLAKRIVAARREASLSRGELAAAVGVDPSTVTGWESGKFQPREGALRKKIAAALGVEVGALFGGSKPSKAATDTIELIDTLDAFPQRMEELLARTKRTLKDVRVAAPYTLPPNVQTAFRSAVSERILDGSLEVLRVEIFYTLDRLKEVLSNIFRYHGRKYVVRSYCPGLREAPPAIGLYAFDDEHLFLGGYWASLPPHDRPGLVLSGASASTFFRAYWAEIWRRGTPLNLGGSDDLSAVRALALAMDLPAAEWPNFVAEARAYTCADGAPPRI